MQFIVLSAVIGGGIFNNDGQALKIAGPAGALLALVVMALVSVAVMEGVSEFVQLFPAPNAIVEYVRAFVDRDLAWVVGIAYWSDGPTRSLCLKHLLMRTRYTYSSIFAIQNLAAANLSRYWGLPQVWQTILFYFVSPAVILAINFVGVGVSKIQAPLWLPVLTGPDLRLDRVNRWRTQDLSGPWGLDIDVCGMWKW